MISDNLTDRDMDNLFYVEETLERVAEDTGHMVDYKFVGSAKETETWSDIDIQVGVAKDGEGILLLEEGEPDSFYDKLCSRLESDYSIHRLDTSNPEGEKNRVRFRVNRYGRDGVFKVTDFDVLVGDYDVPSY